MCLLRTRSYQIQQKHISWWVNTFRDVAQWGSCSLNVWQEKTEAPFMNPDWHQSFAPCSDTDTTERSQAENDRSDTFNDLFSLCGGVLRLNTKIKSTLETETEETANNNWYVNTCWGAVTVHTAIFLTQLLFSLDSLNIQLSSMFTSPLSLLWQAFMIILSGLSRLTCPLNTHLNHKYQALVVFGAHNNVLFDWCPPPLRVKLQNNFVKVES